MAVMTSADSPACGNSAWLLLASDMLCCAVTRFQCHSDLYEMDLMMDINTSIYPLHVSRLSPITSFASGDRETKPLCYSMYRCNNGSSDNS